MAHTLAVKAVDGQGQWILCSNRSAFLHNGEPALTESGLLAPIPLPAQSTDWPGMPAAPPACDPSIPETRRDTFAPARDSMCLST